MPCSRLRLRSSCKRAFPNHLAPYKSQAPRRKPMSDDQSDEKPENRYEIRLRQRKERYEALAQKAKREADAANSVADQIASFIPLGQPILIGHHSEGRHRRDLKRIRQKTEQAIEGWRKSEYYARRASSAGESGISSDDP